MKTANLPNSFVLGHRRWTNVRGGSALAPQYNHQPDSFSHTLLYERDFSESKSVFMSFKKVAQKVRCFLSPSTFNIPRSSSSYCRSSRRRRLDSVCLRRSSALFVRLCLPLLLSPSPRNSFPHCADNNLHKTPRRKHTVLDPRLQHPLHSKASPSFQGLSFTEIERDCRPLC